jgi:glutamate synthase (NADPH/NADH) small chain
MLLQKMALGEPDASGRRRPVPIDGAIETIEIDEVIVSVGVSPNPLIPSSFKGLEVTKWGTIVVDESSMRSSLSDVYAGGDIVRGGATVILAMGDGRKAAAAMHEAFGA